MWVRLDMDDGASGLKQTSSWTLDGHPFSAVAVFFAVSAN